jgi:hypothetical protein
MKAGSNADHLIRHGVYQLVGKMAKPGTAKFSPHGLILERVLPNRQKRRLYCSSKFDALSGLLPLIPVTRLGDFNRSDRPNYQFSNPWFEVYL